MKLELFNTTDRVKIVPGYRYSGKKITLEPKASYGIEDYMTSFYRPYARIGVIVRAAGTVETEVTVDETINDTVIETPTEEVTTKTEDVEVEAVEETVEETIEDVAEEVAEEVIEEATEETVYTAEELNAMEYNKLKSLAEELGVNLNGSRKKKAIVDAILGSQK